MGIDKVGIDKVGIDKVGITRALVVRGGEAGRFREVAGVSIVAAACPRSAVDTSTVDSLDHVGPHPHAAGNLYAILYSTACPREHAFRRCSFRGWRFKYNTRKRALSKVEVLNLPELSVLSDLQLFLR